MLVLDRKNTSKHIDDKGHWPMLKGQVTMKNK